MNDTFLFFSKKTNNESLKLYSFERICKGQYQRDNNLFVEHFIIVLNCLLLFQKRIPYTQLVLATGSNGPFPGKCTMDEPLSKNLMTMYENFTEEVKQANSVVIVGGGAVGVELAGDIATDYPGQKSVSLFFDKKLETVLIDIFFLLLMIYVGLDKI